jgi:hypothetical protein
MVVTGMSSTYMPVDGRYPACNCVVPLVEEMPRKKNAVWPGPHER